MWDTVHRGWRSFIHLNDRFAEFIQRGLSFSLWLTLMTLVTAAWLCVNHLVHQFDPNDNSLILALTIITALDAAATKLSQLAQRKSDEKREMLQAQIIQKIRDVAIDTSSIVTEIRNMIDQAEPRDRAMFAFLERLADALDVKGGEAT